MGQETSARVRGVSFISPGVASPFFSTIVLFKNQLFPQGFGWFFRKKDAWKEWGSYE